MSKHTDEILDTLRFELDFMETGLYGLASRSPWGQPSVFQDSMICINYGDYQKNRPCIECALGGFVPPEYLSKSVPCHHIPLNQVGDTIDRLEWQTDGRGIEEAVKRWLRATIKRLEEEQALEGRPSGAL